MEKEGKDKIVVLKLDNSLFMHMRNKLFHLLSFILIVHQALEWIYDFSQRDYSFS